MRTDLLHLTPGGLYCEAGNFHVDPWRPVATAVITHAHSDHAVAGCGRYLASAEGEPLLRLRLGGEIQVEPLEFDEPRQLGGVQLSLHPAGHIRGSAQVRIASRDGVLAFTGDFKCQQDRTCAGWQAVPCDVLVTESTFGLPVFRWPRPGAVIDDIHAWWRANQAAGRASLLCVYALGKAQRVLSLLDPAIGPIFSHGAVEKVNAVYRSSGVPLPETQLAVAADKRTQFADSLIVAPPSALGSSWLRRFGRLARGMVSGWMQVRGFRRRRSIDRGFVLSDHADWPGLLEAVQASGARRVLTTHGYAEPFARYLREQELDAHPLATPFQGEMLGEATVDEEEQA